jgi:hypothetical protein
MGTGWELGKNKHNKVDMIDIVKKCSALCVQKSYIQNQQVRCSLRLNVAISIKPF